MKIDAGPLFTIDLQIVGSSSRPNDGPARIPAVVEICGFKDFVLWQRKIQPFVEEGTIGSNWYWPGLFLACSSLERFSRRTPIGIQVKVAGQTRDGKEVGVPVAQAIFTVPYRWPRNSSAGCAFLWYVAAAPRDALYQYSIFERPRTLPAVLCAAIWASFLDPKGRGKIGLHATYGRSEAESAALAAKYRACGLTEVPAGGYLSWPNRKHDGRMFYFDTLTAAQYLDDHVDLRV